MKAQTLRKGLYLFLPPVRSWFFKSPGTTLMANQHGK